MVKVYVLLDSDREPRQVFASMALAEAFFQEEMAEETEGPIEWRGCGHWAYCPLGGLEFSILSIDVHHGEGGEDHAR